jgi:hypothetical protein
MARLWYVPPLAKTLNASAIRAGDSGAMPSASLGSTLSWKTGSTSSAGLAIRSAVSPTSPISVHSESPLDDEGAT